ncbi:hypothetical protein GGS23DRAFT_218204 [Durotheca rogersii]|uniref:uncharacterized protein n=1 Tax=Durotheca rogersii TaxID=419775 RepID=UPI00221EBB0C|nr:uncharacterized protein GGS23DRAFT_218204 [Durotheca rogersii]KAI5860645.1 hypothetical protein GGS23DRAFT_218204 [Durotheca rogersii]
MANDKRITAKLDELRDRRCSRSRVEEEWWCVSLSIDEFGALEARLEADERSPSLFSSSMRTSKVSTAHIIEQLFSIEQGNDQAAADFAWGIMPCGSSIVEDEGLHHPDRSYAHEDARRLGVIIEVSHSQKGKDLPYLADDCILGSKGLTQLVIGIDLNYQDKEAKVMTWRPTYLEVLRKT